MIDQAKFLSSMKNYILEKGWGESLDLLSFIEKLNPDGLAAWIKHGSTIKLRDELCLPFKQSTMYRERDHLAWFNDFTAIDAAGSYARHPHSV